MWMKLRHFHRNWLVLENDLWRFRRTLSHPSRPQPTNWGFPTPSLTYVRLSSWPQPQPPYYLLKCLICNPNKSWKILRTLEFEPTLQMLRWALGPTLSKTMDVIYEWIVTGIGIAFDWKIWILNIRNNNQKPISRCGSQTLNRLSTHLIQN
jgi:hypothetical protein